MDTRAKTDHHGFAPPGTPGYTGKYRVREGYLCAMQPDGVWVPIRGYDDDFKTKEALR